MDRRNDIKGTFKGLKLDSRIEGGISKAGFINATPVQEKAIPQALTGRDLIVTAQTGTGKTAAFLLPVIHHILNSKRNSPGALIITPTRELASQIKEHLNKINHKTNIKSVCIYGGVSQNAQIRGVNAGADIIIACPGRLLDLVNQGHIDLKSIDILVLDEADRMLDMGFLPDIKRILSMLPQKRQNLLFSATFPRKIEKLAKQTLNNPLRIEIGITAPVNTVSHSLFPVPQHLKARLLFRVLNETETSSVLIFTRTKHKAKKIAIKLRIKGYNATSLHGNLSQRQRDEAIRGFTKGKYSIMVATDIAARGLDIEKISHVINFDMPGSTDDYIHRIGRTGRAKRSGEAFTFITRSDEKLVSKLERITGEKIERKILEDFDYAHSPDDIISNKNHLSKRRAKTWNRRNN